MEQLRACDPENRIQFLQHDSDGKSTIITNISHDIKSVMQQLATTNDALENCLQAIAAIKKREDRLNSSVVAKVLKGTSTMTAAAAATEEDQEGANMEPSAEQQPSQLDELQECQHLLDARMQELAKSRQEKDQLHARLDDLLDRFSQLSSDYIKSNSIYVNHLQSMIELECNLIEYYEQRRASLVKEKDGFTRERRQLIDQQNSEMSSREATLVTETKRLQETLLRVRNQRDGLQQDVQSCMMEEKQVSAYHDQIINMAEKEKVTGPLSPFPLYRPSGMFSLLTYIESHGRIGTRYITQTPSSRYSDAITTGLPKLSTTQTADRVSMRCAQWRAHKRLNKS